MRTQGSGLSLLEVVFSVGILFLTLLVLLNLATTSLFGTKEGAERLTAENFASSVLETYRSRPLASYPLNSEIKLADHQEDGTTYQGVLQATPVAGYSSAQLRALTLTVKWDSKRGPKTTKLTVYATPLLH